MDKEKCISEEQWVFRYARVDKGVGCFVIEGLNREKKERPTMISERQVGFDVGFQLPTN